MPLQRPIDIARKFGISTTTLRHYEEIGMIPPVLRASNGYRIYTDEHIAYFVCIREMMQGFILPEIAKMLKLVIANKIDEALWLTNRAQAALLNDKNVCEKIKIRFLQKKKASVSTEYTIDAVSKLTGITSSTIRYWDKIGLLSVSRCTDNNYRIFTQTQMDEILLIQALKLAMQARGEKYMIEQIRKDMKQIDLSDLEKLTAIVSSIEHHLAVLNLAQIRSISALCNLCNQVKKGDY